MVGNRKVLAFFFVLLAVVSLLNVWLAFFSVPAFGDGGVIAVIMFNSEQFPAAKYLVGMGLMRTLYGVSWGLPVFSQWLPEHATSFLGFIRVGGILLMLLSSLLLLAKSRNALRILLAVMAPIWLLFSIGYVEYYPFIAGALLAFLYWLFSRSLTTQPAILVGASCALLPLLYAGFMPYAVIVLALYLYGASLRTLAATLLAAMATFLATVWLFWKGGVLRFFDVLLQDLNLGERNTLYAGYKGLAAGSHSIFFNLDYVFSLRHLREVLQMAFSGMGPVALCVLPVAVLLLVWRRTSWDRNDLLALLLALWALAYLLLMMPKLGPVQDLDLFFSSYLTMAFFIGLQFERHSLRVQTMLLFAWAAGSVASMFYLFRLSA